MKFNFFIIIFGIFSLILSGCTTTYEQCTTDECFEKALESCSKTERKQCWMGWCQTTRIMGEEDNKCIIYHFSESDNNINDEKTCSIKKGAKQRESNCMFSCSGDYISPSTIC
ncbi:MAG: hypothetical protein ACMXYK_03430 [Candidatus Woesearchaeota archaeon]